MPRNYRIHVTGARLAAREVGSIERQLRRELREATTEIAKVLEKRAASLAPRPDPHTAEARGEGVFAEDTFRPERRLAGRAPRALGGGFMVELEWEIALGVEEDTVSAYTELGTGIYRDPEHGGPRSPWFINPTQGHGLLGPMRDKKRMGQEGFIQLEGERDPQFFVKGPVRRVGSPPRPFLGQVEVEAADEIEALYDRAVARAVRRG